MMPREVAQGKCTAPGPRVALVPPLCLTVLLLVTMLHAYLFFPVGQEVRPWVIEYG